MVREASGRDDRERARLLAAIVLIGLGARLGVVLALNQGGLWQSWNEHWQIASSLHEGRGFAFRWYGLFPEPQVGSFLPPLYPWILAGLLFLAGGASHVAVWLAQGINLIVGTATIWLVARLAALSGGAVPRAPSRADGPDARQATRAGIAARVLRDPALLAGLAWALYPPALGHVAQANTQTLETFLLVLLAYLALSWRGRASAWLPAGLTLGLLLLTRPAAGLVWFLWGLAFVAWRPALTADMGRPTSGGDQPAAPGIAPDGVRPSRLAAFRYVALATALAALVLLPWTIRNFAVHGRLVPVSTNGGFNFYMGNHATGHGDIPPLAQYFARLTEEERASFRALSESDRDRRFYALGREYWRTQPVRALRGVWNRLVSYVLWRPYLFAAYPRWLALVFIASYLLLFVPFVLSLRGPPDAGRTFSLLAFAGTGAAGLVWIVSMRFRATVEPFLAVAGMSWVARRVDRGKRRAKAAMEAPPAV